jgi:hypothetical protein
MVDGARRSGVAAHPAVVAALAVLIVNDQVLKAWSGGVDGLAGTIARTVTGKASDVAGVLLLAVLLGVLTGRRHAAVLAVAVGFAALKLSPAVADLAVPVLGGRTRTDPWDLLALVALLPADRILRRDLPALDLRPAWASARATLGLAVVVLGVPAMTATSCPDDPTGLNRAGVLADGRVVAWGQEPDWPDPFNRTRDWWTSADGGRTWRSEPLTDDERRELRGVARRAEDDPEDHVCTPTGCVRHGHDAASIEEGSEIDGWTTSFAYSDSELTAMEANETPCGGELDPSIDRIVEVDGTVVATAGVLGIVRRAPGGDWEQVSVGEWERPADLPSPWPRHLVLSPFPALALFVVLFRATLTRSPGRSSLRPLSVFLALLGAIVAGGVALVVSLGADARERGVAVGIATAVVLAVALLPLAWLLIWPRAAPTPTPDDVRPGPPGVRPGPDRREPPPPPGPSGWI